MTTKNTKKLSKDSLKEILSDRPEFSLQQVLKDPILLNSFETYLVQNWSQENLLFIEAMNQLRHESAGTSKDVEEIFLRIYNTFIAIDSPLEINIYTQEKVREKVESIQWSLITRDQALDILKDTEEEVLAMLVNKLVEFLGTPLATVSSKQSKIYSGPVSDLQKRVVIVGGGFTGFTVASILDPMSLFHVTLIDTKDSFEYTPHIITKIVNPEKVKSLRFTHNSYVKNGKVIMGYAEDICEDAKCVKVNGEKIYFDYLVLATGSSYAGQLKSSDSSPLYRTAGLSKVADDILNAKKILIIGGGLVGCELAAAIAQKRFTGPYPTKKVVLIEGHGEIIHRSEEKQRKKAESFLKGLGIEIVLNEHVKLITTTEGANMYRGSSGRNYSSKEYTTFMATGVKVNTQFIEESTNEPSLENCLDNNGLIRVLPTLQVDHWKYKHIFAGGDATNVTEEKTAYAATIAGVCIARNICRIEKGKQPITQGTKGLLAPPSKALHGEKSHGGIGKKRLSFLERTLSFMNPNWQVLKYFNEEQFFKIIQETSRKSNIIGRLPKALSLPIMQDSSSSDSYCSLRSRLSSKIYDSTIAPEDQCSRARDDHCNLDNHSHEVTL